MRENFTHRVCYLTKIWQNSDGIADAFPVLEMKTQMTTRGRGAFTLIELLVIIALVVVFVVFLLPAFAPYHNGGQHINCINNLKQDDLAFKMWANDNNGKYPMQVSITNGGAEELYGSSSQFSYLVFPIFITMSNEINVPKILHCPADTKTIAATNFTTDFNNDKISYFVNLDADDSSPNSILMGDDNFASDGKPVSSGILNLSSNVPVEWTDERHRRAGNIVFADGSVSQMSNDSWHKLIETNVTLSRLVIP